MQRPATEPLEERGRQTVPTIAPSIGIHGSQARWCSGEILNARRLRILPKFMERNRTSGKNFEVSRVEATSTAVGSLSSGLQPHNCSACSLTLVQMRARQHMLRFESHVPREGLVQVHQKFSRFSYTFRDVARLGLWLWTSFTPTCSPSTWFMVHDVYSYPINSAYTAPSRASRPNSPPSRCRALPHWRRLRYRSGETANFSAARKDKHHSDVTLGFFERHRRTNDQRKG